MLLASETLLLYTGLAMYLMASLLSIRYFASGRPATWGGRAFVGAGVLLHIAAMIIRGRATGYFPAQGLHEFGILTFTTMMLVALVIDLAKHMPSLLYGAAPVATIGIPLAGLIQRTTADGGAPAMSVWTGMHVIATMAGYACFLIAFVSGAIYLEAQRELKSKSGRSIESRFPPLEASLRVNRGSVLIGFLLLTAGIVMGYLYARSAPPAVHVWQLDPKIIMTTITWLCYGIVLMLPWAPRYRGRPVVVASMLSFVIVILSVWVSLAWTEFHRY